MATPERYASPECEEELAPETPATTNAAAANPRKRGRPPKDKNDNDEEEKTQAKRRLVLRDLTPLDFVGRRKGSNDCVDQIHELAFINAIWERRHCRVVSTDSKVRPELLQAVSTNKWVNDPDCRYQVGRWAAPLDPMLALRELPGDQRETCIGRDHVGDVMRAFKLTSAVNKPLHIPCSSWSPASLPASECDVVHDNFFLDGPDGGLEGSVETVLFRIDKADEVNLGDVNSDLMTFMYLMALALCKDDSDHIFYAVQTEFADIMTRKNKYVHICNVRQRVASRVDAVKTKQKLKSSNVLDEHLKRKLLVNRHRDKHAFPASDVVESKHGVSYTSFDMDDDVQLMSQDDLICSSQQISDPQVAGQTLTGCEEQPETFTSSGPPCRIFYTVHIVEGLDENQQPVKYYMQCVTVRGTVVGVEPLVAMRQACNMFDELGLTLLRIAKHMCNVMQTPSHDFIDRLFSTGSAFNCVNIFDPVNLLEAIFRRAAQDGVSDVHFKGQRLNMGDVDEMEAWHAFKTAITDERKEYYDKIKQKTDLIMAQRSGFEMAREPDQTFAPVVYTGVHARLVETSMLKELRIKYIGDMRREKWLAFLNEKYDNTKEDDEVEEHIEELKHNFQELYADGGVWHSAVDADLSFEHMTRGAVIFQEENDMHEDRALWAFWVNGPLNTTGPGTIVFEFNMQAQTAFDKKTTFSKELLPDSPFMFDPLATIYLEQHLQEKDRFQSYWHPKCTQVPTIEHLLSRDFELPEHLLTMRMQLLDAMAFVSSRSDEGQSLRSAQVEELVGASVRGGRTVRDVLEDVNRGAQLGTMMRQRELMLKTWITNERRRMATSDLRHMAAHLQIINDLKLQGRHSVKLWTRSANHNNLKMQNQACAHQYASDSARANEIWCNGIKNLDTGLCTVNLALCLTFVNSVVSYFSRNKKTAVGYPILLSDCGMQVTQTEVTNHGLKTSVVQKKSSGAGADLLLLVSTVMLQAYAINMPLCSAVRAYMMRRENQLKNHKRVSQLAWRQIGNVAVWRDEQGKMKSVNRQQCSKIGQMAAMTETMKMQSNHDGGGNTFGRAEQAVGNPLQRAVGPQEEAWSTTQNLNNQTLETLYNGIPLFLLAGNRPDGQFPPSALEGGRLKPCFAAVQDHHGKLLVTKGVQRLIAVTESESALTDNKWKSGFIDPEDEDSVVKIATKEMTEQNVVMLAAMWCTQPFAFIKACMQLDYESRTDTLRTQTHNIVQNFMTLSQGLRRGENAGDMNRKKDVYTRVMSEGAFTTVDTPGIHAQQQLLLAFQRRAELPCIDQQGNTVLNLEAAFEDSLMSMLDVPVSINTVMSSLYLTLSTYVLNINVMIASCFFLFCARCYTHCPLHVLAAAAHRLELNDKEEIELRNMFVFFDRLCQPVSDKPRGSCKLVSAGWLHRTYSVEDVLLWLDFKQCEDARDDILSFHTRNAVGSERTRFVMVQEQIFRAPPLSWVSGRGRKNARTFTVKVNSINELKLIFLAEMQKPESHQLRKHEWNAMHTSSLSGSNIALFVDTEAFWETAGKGTRFPQTVRMSTDENDTPHMATQETANFYASLLHDMSIMHGFIEHVLQYMRLPQNTSRQQLFETIFQRYRTNSETVVSSVRHIFPKSADWKTPILAGIGEQYEPFTVEMRPHVIETPQSAAMPGGVHVILGVDVLWLLLSQIYTGSWVQKSSTSREIKVHLNNMGFAAQSLLSLFISLQMELASVPIMSHGAIKLLGPCNKNVGESVQIPFDERLHIDFHEQNITCLNGSGEPQASKLFFNIAFAWRKPRAFAYVQCKNDQFVMTYTNQIYKGEEVYIPEHEHLLIPLPMETVAHMNFVKYMRIFIARFHAAFPEVVDALMVSGSLQNILVLAMQLGGRSLDADFMLHIALELTWSSMKEDELPVVALGSQAFIAVAKRRGNTYTLEPTVPRSSLKSPAWSKVLHDHDMPPLAALPLHTQVQWRVDELGVAQSRGLYFEDGEAHMRRPRDPLPHTTKCVPLVVMPLCQHQALVCVQPGLSEIALLDSSTGQKIFVTRMQVREFFSAHEPMRWTLRRSMQWLADQVDIVPLSKEEDEIYVVELPGEAMQFWVVTANEKPGERDRIFFHSRAHLKFVLNANQGCAMSAEEREVWVHRSWLFGHDSYNDLLSPHIFERLHLAKDKSAACTFAIYKDDEYEQLFPAYKRALARHQEAQLRSDMRRDASVQQGMQQICDTRNALQRSKATRKLWMTLEMRPNTIETFVLEAPEKEGREHSLGMLVHHVDDATWLQDGCYRVSFVYRNNVYSNKMDWATSLMCMVREGQRLYMRLTHEVYKDIRARLKNASLPDALMHHAVLTERRAVLLECYYVLGESSRCYYKTFDELVVDVVILVHKRHKDAQDVAFDDKNTECKFFYPLKVRQNDSTMLTMRAIEDMPCVGHLVCKNARDRLQDSAANEEGWDEAAEEHLAQIGPHATNGREIVYWE